MATKKANTKRSSQKVNTGSTSNKTRIVQKKTIKNVSRSARANTLSNLMLDAPLGALFAEFIGTFMLAAVFVTTQGQPIFVLFALAAIILTIGHLSGAHVNPAITFGAWISKKLSTKRAAFYVIAQILGAMFALVVLNYLLVGSPSQQNPMTGEAQASELFKATQAISGKEIYAFVATLIGVAIFAFGFASALREKKEQFAAAFTIAGSLFIGLIIAGQAAILNPAVALTLQSFSELKGDNAVSWAIAIQVGAPLIGAAIGFLLYDLFRKDVDTTA